MLKINFTEEDAFHLAMIQGPVWHDTCDHKEGSYVVSFEVFNHRQNRMDQYDLYIFDNVGRQEVCIRYGKECNEYISSGDFGSFIARANDHEPYQTAVRILLHYGNVSWGLKKEFDKGE